MGDLRNITTQDIAALADTIYGEASSETDAARIGVGSVILTRAEEATWPGGKSIAGVCEARRQFDCWDAGTPDEVRMQKAAALEETIRQDSAYVGCRALAKAMLCGDVKDNTDGAVFYHDISRPGPPSAWGAVKFTVQHGRLKFYAKG
jgi:spore germination cell wall hydrolase CwlJ-like protein